VTIIGARRAARAAARAPSDEAPARAPVGSATTVIVPTRNEEANVGELLRRLVPGLPRGSEVIFVDDSDDGTVAAVESAAAGLDLPVRVHHREPGERGDGLGGAVAAGLSLARCDWCVVMDADLQHPPELVPQLVAAGEATGSQLVVASRYNGAGDASAFSRGRAAMSTWATRLTKAFFPRRLGAVSDPMSGFFAVRRDAVDVRSLRPNGFKILLEVAVRCGPLRTTEVPFHFGRRFAGESKASLAEGVRLVVLLARLWFDCATARGRSRMVAFALVGAAGLVVNTVALYLATGVAGLHYAWGAALATLLSTTFNWGVLELLVYPGGSRRSAVRRYLAFGAVNVVALLARIPLMALLIERLGANYLLANLVSLLLLFALRFAVSDTIIFRRSRMSSSDRPLDSDDVNRMPRVLRPPTTEEGARPHESTPAGASNGEVVNGSAHGGLNGWSVPRADEPPTPALSVLAGAEVAKPVSRPGPVNGHRAGTDSYLGYRYDIPGVATIGSQVPLPELQWFLAPFLTRGPFDVEIRVGRVGHARRRVLFTADEGNSRTYEEHLGAMGANFRVEMGETIQVTAGPLLERSPHVLYTNIVEALLRFLAVAHGRLLLHSACVRIGDTGVMLSARTDTGKTGTVLRLIRDQGAVFLSDDMTIVDPDGTAHCFPKPLTISHHTLRAVDSHGLSRTEWGKLRVQSRLHSKEGRQFGMRLAQHNVPIMTFNALTQALVPPPKYDVDRLVPCDVAQEVTVEDLFIIERGTNTIAEVPHDQAVEELLENTDDAYGFPPFSILAPTLRVGGLDYPTLRERERSLLDEALGHIRVRRLPRDDFGWPAQISALLDQEHPTPRHPGSSVRLGSTLSPRGSFEERFSAKQPNPVYVLPE